MKALLIKIFEWAMGDLEGECACYDGWCPLDENAMVIDG